MNSEGVTIKHMCECISDYIFAHNGERIHWGKIYTSSPTGELYHVIEFYQRIQNQEIVK